MALTPTSNPTQIGYIPYDSSQPLVFESGVFTPPSTVVIGRDTTVSWEAIGYGSGARPDILQQFQINLSYPRDLTPVSAENPLQSDTHITLNVEDLVSVIQANYENFPTTLNLTLKEVSVCEVDDITQETVEKRMIIIGSQTYLPSGSS